MPRTNYLIPALIVLSGLLPLTANSIGSISTMVEGEIDMDFMQDVEDVSINLTDNIARHDTDPILSDAKELINAFAQIEAFYIAKGDTEDAVQLSRKSKELSQKIIQQIDSKDFDSAAASATELARACKSCHNFYRKD
ncbi:MAG: cytochrome c [Zoogloeaceae bacterium]|nr:cytochrome c [Zoogloeaceae bacterium]